MIDVLVPVLGRPERVVPLLKSFHASLGTEPAHLLFIASPEDRDEIAMLRDVRAEILIVDFEAGHADYARKIQAGFEATAGEWIFTGADDVHFHPGWADQGLKIARATSRRVIGTADLGNPEVKRGHFATHMFFARSYVLEHGTLDGPGWVFSNVYDHNWVDKEACLTAQSRNEWAFAPNSVVEHLHFHWGHGRSDDTYRKGLLHFQDDRRKFVQRMRRKGLPIR